MSNPGAPKSPWESQQLDPVTLLSAVASEATAVAFADADVEAANMRLSEEIAFAQRGVQKAKEGLATRQQALRESLQAMNLVGRTIDFAAGTTLGAVDFVESSAPYPEPKSVGEDLTDSGGVITGFEVGTFAGRAIEPADTIVLLVDMDDARSDLMYAGLPDHRYAVVAGQGDYKIGKAPSSEQPES